MDEVLRVDVIHVLGGVQGASLPLAHGDVANVFLDDSEVARGFLVAAGDEAVR